VYTRDIFSGIIKGSMVTLDDSYLAQSYAAIVKVIFDADVSKRNLHSFLGELTMPKLNYFIKLHHPFLYFT